MKPAIIFSVNLMSTADFMKSLRKEKENELLLYYRNRQRLQGKT